MPRKSNSRPKGTGIYSVLFGDNKTFTSRSQHHFRMKSGYFNLISISLPLFANAVIPEVILIGDPGTNRLKFWIPDEDIRG